jgi:exodeoxyribonuclease V alpha subunit
VVVVDEASMVDLSLMRRLVAAVLPAARLILLGDRHQLASVEAGAVLADLSGPPSRPPYSERLARAALATFGEALPGSGDGPGGLADSLVELTASHRFAEHGGSGVSRPRNLAGDGDAAVAACEDAAVTLAPRPRLRAGPGLRALQSSKVSRRTFGAPDPAEPCAALGRFRARRTAAARRGFAGLVARNRWRSRRQPAAPAPGRRLTTGGRPVTENDPGLALWERRRSASPGPRRPDQPARLWLAVADGRAAGAHHPRG